MREQASPVDPDVDLHIPADRAELSPSPVPVLTAVAAGGVLGALARHGIVTAWPHPSDGFAWSTLTVNLTGSLLIGVLMVLVNEVWPGRRLVRPFLGVGVLGGYTTFSAHVLDIGRAAGAGAAGTALAYLTATLAGAVLAVWVGTAAAHAMLRRRAGGRRAAR